MQGFIHTYIYINIYISTKLLSANLSFCSFSSSSSFLWVFSQVLWRGVSWPTLYPGAVDCSPAETHPVAGLQRQSVSSRCCGGNAVTRPSCSRLERPTKVDNLDSWRQSHQTLLSALTHGSNEPRSWRSRFLPCRGRQWVTRKAEGRVTDHKRTNAETQSVLQLLWRAASVLKFYF